MIVLVMLISAFISISVYMWRGRSRNPKGPFPLPVIGNVHQLVYQCWKNGGIVSGLNVFERQFGKVFTIWFGPLPVVFIGDFDVAHETHVKRANVFGRRFAIGGMNYIRASSVCTANVEKLRTGQKYNGAEDAFLYKMEKDEKEGVTSTFNLETLALDMYDLWIGGQETTSTTLTWACTCFLNHPEVVRKLRKELLSVTSGTRTVSLTDRPNTPYLTATVNEVQRIASILTVNLLRQMEEDTVIDGQPLAAGTVVLTRMSMIHSDEELFKQSTEFRPERFLKNKNLEKKLIPFGIGKRACPGESLARAELYLIIGNMVLNYDLEVVDRLPPIETPFPFSLAKCPPCFSIRFVPVDTK